MPSDVLDPLARRITGALQVNGRASWRRIAQVLDEPTRTVARRGAALLDERVVQVIGLTTLAPTHLLRLRCHPGRVEEVAAAATRLPESVFVYELAEAAEVVVELMAEYEDLTALIGSLLGPLDGVRDYHLLPVLHYFCTVADWQPGLLTTAETSALEVPGVPPEQHRPDLPVDDVDRRIIRALSEDGRAPFESIAAIGGFSEATARRRIELMLQEGLMRIRAVVEPARVGLPMEALLWIRCHPRHVYTVGAALAAAPEVRYAAMVMGEDTIVADVTVRDTAQLRDFLVDGRWTDHAETVRPTLLLRAFKRGGAVLDSARGTGVDPVETT